jgi:hypothetical protein
MRSPSIFKRRKRSGEAARIEPRVPECAASAVHEASDCDDVTAFDTFSSSPASDANDGVLALFSASMSGAADALAPSVKPATSVHDSDELIRALHGQYCAALDLSNLASSASWDASPVSAVHLEAFAGSHDDASERAHDDVSISELFSEPQRLEEAIGPLLEGDALDAEELNLNAAPEILRLFAPSEYHVNGAAQRRFVPPPLARREHHTLAIDSPVPGFGAVSRHGEGVQAE